MCTAISTNGFFGRTLDIECSYGEEVVITPRNFKIEFMHESSLKSHLANIGIASIRKGGPFY